MESIYQKLVEIEEVGIPSALCTLIESSGSTPRKAGTKMIVFSDGSIYGTIGGGMIEKLVIDEAVSCLQMDQSKFVNYQLDTDAGMTCGGQARVFIEPLSPKKRLYIFGAGHIGSFLAKLAQMLDFKVTLIDERPGIFNTIDRTLIDCKNMPHQTAIEELLFDGNTFVCVTTHNHTHDKEIIGMLAVKKLAYIGMIGSKSKVAQFSKELLDLRVLTSEQISNIDWPMGIPINCQTPQEIAVSVLAKLVDVRSPSKKNKN